MKNIVGFVGSLLAAFVLSMNSVFAAAGTTLTSNSSTAVSLSSGTETINPGVTLGVSGSTVAITVTGSSAIANSGTISQTGTGRAIRNTASGITLTVTNNTGASITAVGSDAFQTKDNTGTVTLYNYGSISTTHADEGANTTGTGDQGVNWNILNSNGTTTSFSNTLYNYAGGSITAYEADAVRPGAGGIIYNSGTIKSTNASDNTSSSDGIDAQDNNTGITIINGASQTLVSGITGANLIEGARHGITGGQQTDTGDTAGSSNGNANGVFDLPFTMSVTNNASSTIQGDNGSGINLDAVDGTERVTIVNSGLISGTGVTRDGDGVDVDGVVNIMNNSGATIVSNNAYQDGSEGVTVGGGTIINSGTIEGKNTNGNSAYARGITLAGIDHTETNGVDTDIPIEKTYANPFDANGAAYTTLNANGTSDVNSTGTSYVTNNSGGLIKGDSDSGIAILGVNTNTGTALYGNYTAANYAVVITNNAGGTIEGNGAVAVIDGSADVTEPNGTGGTTTVGTASANNETVINYGTIQQDGTGKAISLGSGTNDVQILGGSASINGDISGGTAANSNTLEIDPTSGKSFSYSHVLSNFNSVSLKSGTITLSGANTYTGNTTVSGGTSYINNASGSGTGSGAVSVSSGATLAGSGTISGAVTSSGTIASGAAQGTGYAGSTNNNGKVNQTAPGTGGGTGGGLTLSSTLGINAGTSLTFALGSGNSTGSTFTNPNTNSTYLTVNGGNGSVTFSTGSTIGINLVDLAATSSSSDTLQLRNQSAYLLMTTGSTLSADLAYNLVTTGGYDANGYVLGIDTNTATGQVQGSTQSYEANSFALAVLDPSNGNNITTSENYSGLKLYLYDGDLEVVPEPSTASMLILALLGGFAFAWKRKKSLKA